MTSLSVGQRIAHHHLRHTDSQLTAGVLTDETLLPVAALQWVGGVGRVGIKVG